MTSKEAFSFLNSKNVAPIFCDECGNNMPCVRRTRDSHERPYEFQTFECAACGHRRVRTVGSDASDADIQSMAERIAGISKDAR